MSLTNNLGQGSIFDLFGTEEEQQAEVVVLDTTIEEAAETKTVGSDVKNGIEKQVEGAVKPTEEELKAEDAKKKLSTFDEPAKADDAKSKNAKNQTKTPPKKSVGDSFKLKPDTIVKYAGQEVAVSRYFTAEQLTKGLEKKVKGEVKTEPISEKDLVKKLNDDFAELMPDLTALVYYEKQNMVVPILSARTKGADVGTEQGSSSEGSFSKKTHIPFQLLTDFISAARHFSNKYGTELHADIYYDYDQQGFFMDFPSQLVHKYWVRVTEEPIETATKLLERNYRKVLEIHSHHTMAANPSEQDNESERSPILYAIVGRIHDYFPEITVRSFNPATQKHVSFRVEQVFETPFNNPIAQYNIGGVEVSE